MPTNPTKQGIAKYLNFKGFKITQGIVKMNQQIMVRDFLGFQIRQEHDTKFFCLNDFLKVANAYNMQRKEETKRLDNFMQREDTLNLIKAIQDNENIAIVHKAKKGKNGGTYAHPLLLIELAMYCNKNFKYQALQWVKDKLCEYRDLGGENYKELASAIGDIHPTKMGIFMPRIANHIRAIVELGDKDWNEATQAQLKYRHKYNDSVIVALKFCKDIEYVCNSIGKDIRKEFLNDTSKISV